MIHLQSSKLQPLVATNTPIRSLSVLALSLGLVLAVFILDYLTGSKVSVTLLYLIPICYGTWFAGRFTGLFVAGFSAIAWLGADLLESPSTLPKLIIFWNVLMLAGIFAIVAIPLASLKREQERLEATVWQRTAKLREEIIERSMAEKKLQQTNAELQNMQMKLIEAAKMETVGRFAAGVAHEVKNPLMTLSMGTDYFIQRQSSNADEAVLLQDMKDSVQRASKIINLMLDFSKPHPLNLAPEDLNVIVENSLQLVRHQLFKQKIEVVCQLQPGLPKLSLDLTRLEHVLLNLFTNAAQAMPDGGTLTVRTRLMVDSATDQNDSSHVIMDVEDTGPGLPDELQPKVFEPFFTTKPPGQGTGLGLAIVQQIVNIHGGSVTLGNRPEGGARATLKFNI